MNFFAALVEPNPRLDRRPVDGTAEQQRKAKLAVGAIIKRMSMRRVLPAAGAIEISRRLPVIDGDRNFEPIPTFVDGFALELAQHLPLTQRRDLLIDRTRRNDAGII